MRSIVASFDPMERWNLSLSAGAFGASLAFASPAFAASVALGAAFEVVSFRTLRLAAQRLLRGELQGGGLWAGIFALRLLMLLASMGVALTAGAHPIGLLIGVSTIVPAVLIAAWRTPPPAMPPAPPLPSDDPSWDRWSVWRAGERELSEEDDA